MLPDRSLAARRTDSDQLRCARLFGLALVLTLTLVATARAEQSSWRAILEITVNEVKKGEALVRFVDGDPWVRESDLEKTGLRQLSAGRRLADSVAYVVLSRLAPGITFQIDEQALVLHITASPAHFGTTVVNVDGGRPPRVPQSQNTSAFVNYATTVRSTGAYDLFTESGISIRGALLTNTLSYASGGRLVRGLSAITIDDTTRLTRWAVGDEFVSTGLLGSGMFLGGISVAREYSLDPYFVRFPTLTLSGAATSPSTVEVYVNDQLVRREAVTPGEFEIQKLPVPNGRGDARLVVRDAFGREQSFDTNFYSTAGVLARGLHEFRYHAGYRRNNAATNAWDYGKAAFLGRHRIGVTDWLTAGGRIEATSGIVSGGPSVALRTPLGEFGTIAGVSRDAGRTGGALSVAYSYSGHVISAGTAATASSRDYGTLSQRVDSERTRLDANGFFSVNLGASGSISARHAQSELSTGRQSSSTSLTMYAPVTRNGTFAVAIGRVHEESRWSTDLSFGLSVFLGGRTTAAISTDRVGGTIARHADIQRSLPVGTGYGYRAQFQDSPQTNTYAAAQYQGSYGRYEVIQERLNDASTMSMTAAGGLVAIGGGVYAARPVQESFALVRVPGVAGVRTYVSNQEVGRTDRAGNVLVPNLLSYYANRLDIADEDIPLNYGVVRRETTVVPPYRGGAMIVFPVERVQAGAGTLLVIRNGLPIVPAYGQLTVDAGNRAIESPVGAGGEFFLENIPAGRHHATLVFDGGSCEFELELPAAVTPIQRLGRLTCTVEEEQDRR